MKSLLTTALAGLMLLGIASAVATPSKHVTNTTPAVLGDGDPVPTCYPSEPGCKPPIPPGQ